MNAMLHRRIFTSIFSAAFILLLLLWVLGLACGIYLFRLTPVDFYSFLTNHPVSFSALFFSCISGICLSYASLNFHMEWVIYLIAFFKGLSHGFCCYGLYCCFGIAAGFMGAVFLFSGSLVLLPMFWFWIRNFPVAGSRIHQDFFLCLMLCLIIFCIDATVILPFGTGLLNLM